MSRTLFMYLFKDLLKVFVMSAVALAAIMSFGGLLKPLTKNDLDAVQIGQILLYLLPAMMTYSLPIAALFATTIVYGRFAADNEQTACRAGGISHLSMATPALLLGLAVAIFSLLFLCFIVPMFTLRVEKVITSNIARVVTARIQNSHRIDFRGGTLYADEAVIPPRAPGEDPRLQIVQLVRPAIISYIESPEQLAVAHDFWTARSATAFIRENDDSSMSLEVMFEGGSKFSADPASGMVGTIGQTSFGPITMDSPLRENSKFMDIFKLKRLYAFPEHGAKTGRLMREFNAGNQSARYAQFVISELNRYPRLFTFSADDDRRVMVRAGSHTAVYDAGSVQLKADESQQQEPIVLIEQIGDKVRQITASSARISARPIPNEKQMEVTIDMFDALVPTEQGSAQVARYPYVPFRVAMPSSVADIDKRPARHYAEGKDIHPHQHATFLREIVDLRNNMLGEIHARVSFAISCLILVLVGCALGIMFRSGDMISAFSVSVIPALLCLALIVTGQHTAENVPQTYDPSNRALTVGLIIIWSGNVVTLLIAGTLLWRLQRT